jgi:DNA polymerase
MNKAERMDKVAERVRNLQDSPLYEYRKEKGYQPVVGEGDLDARVMLIGEAPGAQEAETGRPFVGNAGKLLDELLASVSLSREEVYITNVVKDRPPGNRDPHAAEIELYGPFLRQQIDIIEPLVIVTLGRFAIDFILEQFDHPAAGKKISELHGQILKARADYGEIRIIPFYHPAAAFYNPDLKAILIEDIQVLDQRLDTY